MDIFTRPIRGEGIARTPVATTGQSLPERETHGSWPWVYPWTEVQTHDLAISGDQWSQQTR